MSAEKREKHTFFREEYVKLNVKDVPLLFFPGPLGCLSFVPRDRAVVLTRGDKTDAIRIVGEKRNEKKSSESI